MSWGTGCLGRYGEGIAATASSEIDAAIVEFWGVKLVA
jgi:hypothetical protein